MLALSKCLPTANRHSHTALQEMAINVKKIWTNIPQEDNQTETKKKKRRKTESKIKTKNKKVQEIYSWRVNDTANQLRMLKMAFFFGIDGFFVAVIRPYAQTMYTIFFPFTHLDA